MKRISALGAIGALVTSTALSAGPLPVSDSGLVTLMPGQIAQFNVVNLDPLASCNVDMSLIDSAGNVVAIQTTQPGIAAGGSVSLSFDTTPLALPISLRAHLDYLPQIADPIDLKDPLDGCYNLLPTLEVIDITGTRVILTNFASIPTPFDGKMKIDVCHNYSKKKPHTINVSVSSWKAHKGHGDRLGACPD